MYGVVYIPGRLHQMVTVLIILYLIHAYPPVRQTQVYCLSTPGINPNPNPNPLLFKTLLPFDS